MDSITCALWFATAFDYPYLEGWALRAISREFATCDPRELARHDFEVVDARVLDLGFVDLNEE